MMKFHERSLLINSFIESMSLQVKASPHRGAEASQWQGVTRYYSGSMYGAFNGVFDTSLSCQCLPYYFDEMEDYFKARNKPFTWWYTSYHKVPSTLQAELTNRGFQSTGAHLGQSLCLSAYEPLLPNRKVFIKQVETPYEYDAFIRILTSNFNMSEGVSQDLANMLQSFGTNGHYRHYLGYYMGNPVGTLTSYQTGKMLCLFNGATLSHARNNGVCSQALSRALLDGRKDGSVRASWQLMSDAKVLGVSKRLQAKTVCELVPFEKQFVHAEQDNVYPLRFAS